MELETHSEHIALICPACKQKFKAPQKRIRDGSAVACSHCSQQVAFSDTSADPQVLKALQMARRIRRGQNAQTR